MEDNLDSAYQQICENLQSNEGQCVLFLGPELSVDNQGRYYKSYFKDLANRDHNIDKYFDTENLFSISNSGYPRELRRLVKEFYTNSGDPVLLEMISRIKFPLIINSCPDNGINKVLKAKVKDLKTGYFSKSAIAKFRDLPKPTKEEPIIYNIFGSIENDQSLILSHGQLYECVECLLGEKSLPTEIEFCLQEASSFIFLGFKFNSWQYQLMCHKLKIKDNNKTVLSTRNSGSNEIVSLIMKNHFEMEFTGDNPSQAIERIIELCKKEYPKALREERVITNKSLYISYARADKEILDTINRESIVDILENKLSESYGERVKIYRDRNELTYGDSIDSFMHRIGKGKAVIRIISQKYLSSKYCMDEALRITKNNDSNQRVFNIVITENNTKSNSFFKESDLSKYKEGWKKRCEAIFNNVDKSIDDTITRETLKRHHVIYLDIFNYIDDFIKEVSDRIHYSLSLSDLESDKDDRIGLKEQNKEEFNNFIKTVVDSL